MCGVPLGFVKTGYSRWGTGAVIYLEVEEEPSLHASLVYHLPISSWKCCLQKSPSVLENLSNTMMWRRQWQPTPVLLPGKSHGRRSLVGCTPWGHEESDTTERLHFHFFLSCIGEGNGNPLQCSCLENPRDGGAWWAAVYGVAQSRTRLKWLSSSSSMMWHHQSKAFLPEIASKQFHWEPKTHKYVNQSYNWTAFSLRNSKT